MLRILTFILRTFLIAAAIVRVISAQTAADETLPVDKSKLSAISLPAGGRAIKDERMPPELRGFFAKLVAAAGDQISQGDSEVIVWDGNYQESQGSEMIEKLETSLKKAGWEFQVGFKDNDCVLFGLYRTDQERRALVGFFVPADDTFIFAVTEMIGTVERSAATGSRAKTYPAAK